MPNIQLSKYFLKVMTVSYPHSSNFNILNLMYLKIDLEKKKVLSFKTIPVCFQTGIVEWKSQFTNNIHHCFFPRI